MVVAELANLEIAMSDLGKVVVLDHVEAERHAMQDLEAEQVIVGYAEETSHQEELPDHVDQIQQLDERVQDDEVVAEPFARPEEKKTEELLHTILEPAAISLVAVLGSYERLYVAFQKLDQLLALCVLFHRLEFDRRVHKVDDLNAALVIQRSPLPYILETVNNCTFFTGEYSKISL